MYRNQRTKTEVFRVSDSSSIKKLKKLVPAVEQQQNEGNANASSFDFEYAREADTTVTKLLTIQQILNKPSDHNELMQRNSHINLSETVGNIPIITESIIQKNAIGEIMSERELWLVRRYYAQKEFERATKLICWPDDYEERRHGYTFDQDNQYKRCLGKYEENMDYLLSKIDILELIVELLPHTSLRGEEIVGYCAWCYRVHWKGDDFSKMNTKSTFHINVFSGIFHCTHSDCGITGNIISLYCYKQRKNQSSLQARKTLIQRYGLPEEPTPEKATRSKRVKRSEVRYAR